MQRVLDVLFNGIERNNEVLVLANEEGTPCGHPLYAVILELGALPEEHPNVVAESPGRGDWTAGLSEGL